MDKIKILLLVNAIVLACMQWSMEKGRSYHGNLTPVQTFISGFLSMKDIAQEAMADIPIPRAIPERPEII